MISQTGQYALKACVYLAQQRGGGSLSGRQIAEKTGIPAKYLSKILGDLVRAGVLDASRGKGGGFRLRLRPREIHLFDLLSPFESFLRDEMACPFRNGECGSRSPCPGHDRWKSVKEGYLCFVQEMTLADVAWNADAPKPAGKRKGTRG